MKHPPTSKSASALPLYLAYLRVSKDDDTTGSHTFDTQEKRIRECLDRRCGQGRYQVEFFKDDGLSGGLSFRATQAKKKTRPTLTLIADRIKAGGCAGLVIYGQNRLFRNIQGLTELINDVLSPSDTPLISATEDIDISTMDGRAMVYLRGIFDEKVREDIVKRNRDAAATRAEAGYVIGQVPYGWMWEEVTHRGPGVRRGIVAVEGEKQWLLYIKERYVSGWNAIKISQELNDRGVRSPLHRELWKNKATNRMENAGREAKWTGSEVWRVIKSPLHSGQIRLRSGELIQGQHFEQRFWEPEVADQLERVHKERVARFKTVTGRCNTPTVLNGLAFCARCGSRLYISSSSPTTRNYTSLKCKHHDGNERLTCPDVVARHQWVEDLIVQELSHIAQTFEMREHLEHQLTGALQEQEAALRCELAQTAKRLDEIEEQSQRWADAYSRGVLKEKQFLVFGAKLEGEEEETRARLQTLESDLEGRTQRENWLGQVRKALLDFPLVWAHLDNDERRQLLALLIEAGGLRIDRVERDIKVQLKIHLLPPVERTIIYHTYQGVNRTKATGLMRLTQTQMLLIHHSLQGKTRPQVAEAMGCKVSSIYTIEKTIRKNMGGLSWLEVLEQARERVELHAPQLELLRGGRGRRTHTRVDQTSTTSFLSPLLIEVLVLFAQGATTTEVATELKLPVVTVQGRRSRILKTLGTKSMLEATRVARASGQLV